MASNLLAQETIPAALKKAAEAGKPGTIKDGEGLTLIARPPARPDCTGWWRQRQWLSSR